MDNIGGRSNVRAPLEVAKRSISGTGSVSVGGTTSAAVPTLIPIWLKCLIFNIDHAEQPQVLQLITQSLRSEVPDVISLTCVTDKAFQMLSEHFSQEYAMFQVFQMEGEPAGIVIMCRYETIEISKDEPPYYFDLPHGGKIIGTGIRHRETASTLNILSASLEPKTDNDHIREEQTETILKIIAGLEVEKCVLLADSNMIAGETDNLTLNNQLLDFWQTIGCPPRIRSTVDSQRNPLVRGDRQERSTRIYYKIANASSTGSTSSTSANARTMFLPKSLALFGTRILKSTKSPVSQHYGLLAVFRIGTKGSRPAE